MGLQAMYAAAGPIKAVEAVIHSGKFQQSDRTLIAYV